MQLISEHFHEAPEHLPRIALRVDRLTLAKRRWRGRAEDGREFGFDLDFAMTDGDFFFQTESTVYQIVQKEEPVLEVPLKPDPAKTAKLGWVIGNLHFPIEVGETIVRIPDDPALRQLFDRERLPYEATQAVFHPLSGGHSHSHSH